MDIERIMTFKVSAGLVTDAQWNELVGRMENHLEDLLGQVDDGTLEISDS